MATHFPIIVKFLFCKTSFYKRLNYLMLFYITVVLFLRKKYHKTKYSPSQLHTFSAKYTIHKYFNHMLLRKNVFESKRIYRFYSWCCTYKSNCQKQVNSLWTHCGVMSTRIRVILGSGNGLFPDVTKPLPEPMLTRDHCHTLQCDFIENRQDIPENIIF